jgi:hypothetical protein
VTNLFGWLVADGWCWFVLREEYCWLVAGGWFVLREKYCLLVADKPSEQASHYNVCSLMRSQFPSPPGNAISCWCVSFTLLKPLKHYRSQEYF